MAFSSEWSSLVPPELERIIQSSHQTLVNLQNEFVPSTYVQNERTVIGIPLLRHTHSLAYSIGFLLKHELVAAAFALSRPLFEGYVRGIWALRCANHKELENAQRDKFPNLSKVVEAIRDVELENSEWVSKVFELNKKSLHSLTHGGVRMIMLLYSDDSEKVESDYPVGEQMWLMAIVTEITLGAAAELRKHLGIGMKR